MERTRFSHCKLGQSNFCKSETISGKRRTTIQLSPTIIFIHMQVQLQKDSQSALQSWERGLQHLKGPPGCLDSPETTVRTATRAQVFSSHQNSCLLSSLFPHQLLCIWSRFLHFTRMRRSQFPSPATGNFTEVSTLSLTQRKELHEA